MEEAQTNLNASGGEQLVHYQVDVATTALFRRATVMLPANVRYAWLHRARRYLHVASSNRVRGEGFPHVTREAGAWICAFAIDL